MLRANQTATYCNYQGFATYRAAVIGDTVVADVAWSYADPMRETLTIKGFASFDAEWADVVAELPSA